MILRAARVAKRGEAAWVIYTVCQQQGCNGFCRFGGSYTGTWKGHFVAERVRRSRRIR